MSLVIQRSYLVELNLTSIAAGQKYYFLDVPQLRSGSYMVQGIEAFDVTQILVSPNSKNVVSAAGSLCPLITFSVRDTEEFYQIPYYTLISKNNAGLIRMFYNKQINLVKSYATLTSVTGLTAAESLLFNFYYKT